MFSLGVPVALSHIFFRSFLSLLTIIVHRSGPLSLFLGFNLSITRVKAARLHQAHLQPESLLLLRLFTWP